MTDRPRLQFRLNTIVIVVALSALALGLAKEVERSRPRGQRASERAIAAVLDARNERKTNSTGTNDPVLIATISLLFAFAYNRRQARADRAARLPKDHSPCRS